MKKSVLLALSCALALTGCIKDGVNTVTITSDDESLSGDTVPAGEDSGVFYKLFVLNEGQWGHNNASLDFLRFSTGTYVTDAFHKMNGSRVLGDTANDLMVYYNYLFITVNQSGLVEVINAINEREITYLPVPSPRSMAVSGSYLYVTSYAGAVLGNDRLGRVYRINLESLSDRDSADVGYQPEGIVATANGDLYVANSGGFHAGYDRRITVLDAQTLREKATIEVAPNLDKLYYDYSSDAVWVTSLGDYETQHTGLYKIGPGYTAAPRSAELADVRVICSAASADGYLYAIGTDSEFDFSAADHSYTLYKVQSSTGAVTAIPFSGQLAALVTRPHSLCVNPVNGDLYIGDAGDYVNPGTVFCFTRDLTLRWQVTAGVIPGKMTLYTMYY